MANIEITDNQPLGIVVWDPVYQDDTMLAAIPAGTYAKGTMLKRDGTDLALYALGDIDDPVAVLAQEYVADGATAVRNRVLISGRVRKSDLLADDGGTPTAPNVDDLDRLKASDIIAQDVVQLGHFDNPNNP
ncbi:MAG: hypothetical protein ACYSUK_10705 [Planctomycetota bacterium]|jgi:hypothetical protein